jgi:hypothetical protein
MPVLTAPLKTVGMMEEEVQIGLKGDFGKCAMYK